MVRGKCQWACRGVGSSVGGKPYSFLPACPFFSPRNMAMGMSFLRLPGRLSVWCTVVEGRAVELAAAPRPGSSSGCPA